MSNLHVETFSGPVASTQILNDTVYIEYDGVTRTMPAPKAPTEEQRHAIAFHCLAMYCGFPLQYVYTSFERDGKRFYVPVDKTPKLCYN